MMAPRRPCFCSPRISVTTSAPISASIIDAKGPGPRPANSTMRMPASGPAARGFDACASDEVNVSVTSQIHLSLFGGCLWIVPPGIAQRHLGGIRPQFCVLLLPFGAGAFLGDLAAECNVDRNLFVAQRRHRLLA